jgi:uncharacterized membrane protein YdbT with pleckstrin-like domain
MGYVEKNLLPNERVIVKGEHHVAAFIGPAALLILGIALITAGEFVAVIGVLLLLVSFWRLIRTAIEFVTSEMALTDKRMIGKSGLIRRDSLDVRNAFVTGLTVNQSIFGRILDYGTVVIKGRGGDVGFKYIKQPQKLRNTVQSYLGDTVPTSVM